MKKIKKPIVLVIFDGFGESKEEMGNAVRAAHMPSLKALQKVYPWTLLHAAGEAVGLLPGYAGNSEVGHLAIGAGRIVDSPLKRMHRLIQEHGLEHKRSWQYFLRESVQKKKTLHFLGLVSDGGVHSHYDHLLALVASASRAGVKKIWIHVWLDGRDVAPRSAYRYLEILEEQIQQYAGVAIASLTGRLYAMDRDQRYDRTDRAVAAITCSIAAGIKRSWRDVMQESYAHSLDDQYCEPVLLDDAGVIGSTDALFFFNIRPERTRQIVERLCKEYPLRTSMSSVQYWDDSPWWAPKALLETMTVEHGFLDVLNGYAEEEQTSIVTIAESEKKAHIGYFLHGNTTHLVSREKQIILPSLHSDSYAFCPEMLASSITQKILEHLDNNYIIANYANADMVGHSGDFKATVKACEILDKELQKVYEAVHKKDGTLIFAADHGNAEKMIDSVTGERCTSHTQSDIIFLVASGEYQGYSFQGHMRGLSAIAPTILYLLGYMLPEEMEKPMFLYEK